MPVDDMVEPQVRGFLVLVAIVISGAFLVWWAPQVRDLPRASVRSPSNPSTSPPGEDAWLPFEPGPDPFGPSPLDLRSMNEAFAGENGFITVRGDELVHAGSGRPVRFWGVNGPPRRIAGEALRDCARMLARRGVNLVRVHEPMFDSSGEVDTDQVRRAQEIVRAMRAEGIYTYFSIYFPLWFKPAPGNRWLSGYDGARYPFAALFFSPEFQAQYRRWWAALLTTPDPATGRILADEPAVAGVEIQNEDSLFFPTFSAEEIPDVQLRILERAFGQWLEARYGSLEAARVEWDGLRVRRDAAREGRMGFRPLATMVRERTRRDQDTARFLLEVQTRFYADTRDFLRDLGFRALVSASNWTTASPGVLGPLEKMSYATGDLMDRHGYFGCNHRGPDAAYSLRSGQTYSDRSALRLEAQDPARGIDPANPAMDSHYDGKPSMISETTWSRPNRFRSEAPLFLSAYGALQHTDAIVHFALDGEGWSVQPRPDIAQPWTLMTPGMMGQFPAAAMIFRRALVAPGRGVAEISLNREDVLRLSGSPVLDEASLDEARGGRGLESGMPEGVLDPLLHYVGRVDVEFTDGMASARVASLSALVRREERSVRSATGELRLDYGRGILTIDAPGAQGVSGRLGKAGAIETSDFIFESDMDLGHVVAVAFDDEPLARSTRILLQVMSEERPTGYQAEMVTETVQRIVSTGRDPWLIRPLTGSVRMKRPDAEELQVTALDHNGYPTGCAGSAAALELQPSTLYYLIEGRRDDSAARPAAQK